MEYFGKIKAYNEQDNILVLELDDTDKHESNLFTKNINNYLKVDFDDTRVISYKQRRKVYVLIKTIAKSMQSDQEAIKKSLKVEYCKKNGLGMFSLSDCTVTTANGFIDYLVNFCLEWNINWASKALDIAKDSYGWEVSCLHNHKCCICGDRMQIAHIHAIGMGMNRQKMRHIGYTVLPLCYKHHHMQHTIGINTFLDKYCLGGVRLTRSLRKELHIGRLNDKYEVEQGEDIEYLEKEG